MKTYKIGTRGSLLAVTQSTLIKNQLELLSGEKFELVLIKTQGDENTSKPLWQLEGKDFFTKELDEALLKDEVDLVIHSYKDLGSERPEGIKLAAVTERRFAHDILLIKNEDITKLKNWEGNFVVGTSSPRRIANLTHSIKPYIPYSEETNLKITCETLRGNVNTRIRKLRDGHYHAIVLALAGIERLAHTEKSAGELKDLLHGLNYFILPESVFPTAASQGALGIETRENRNDDGKLLTILSQLTHAKTLEEVSRERKAFKEFGGGCHLAMGIHVKKIQNSFLHVQIGEVDGLRIEKRWLEGNELPRLEKGKKLFVGLPFGQNPHLIYDEFVSKTSAHLKLNLDHQHVFVTTRYCIPTLKMSNAPEALWASGTKTAKKLAAKGFWVNGTSDSLGTEDLKKFKSSKALQMIHSHIQSEWAVFSHKDSSSDIGVVYHTYERSELATTLSYEKELKDVGACYWTSYLEYVSFTKKFPHLLDVHHFCGLGKTWEEFQKAGVNVHPVASMQEYYSIEK